MKKHLILNIALLIVGALAFLVIMPFINFQEFNDTAFAMTNTDCWSCHGCTPYFCGYSGPYNPDINPNNINNDTTKKKHHLYYRVQNDDACTMCHYSSYWYDDCVSCHTSGSIYSSTSSNHSDCKLVAHNNASPDSTDCSACHATNVVTEHNKYFSRYGLLCGLCHQIPNFVNAYNTQTNVVNTIAKGSGVNGQTVYCTSCHVTTDHAAAHDYAKIDSDSCKQCHDSNVVTEHANRNLSCATCHNYTGTKLDPTNVANQIEWGKAGTTVLCSDCHGTVEHETVHEKIVYASSDPDNLITSGCTVCHKPVALQEHSIYNVSCAACHNYSPYKEIIEIAVITNAPAVTCWECHDGVSHPSDIDKTAHDTTKITYPGSDCTDCHSSSDAVTEHKKYNISCYGCHTNNNPTKNNPDLTYQQVISNAIKQVFDEYGNKLDPTPVSCTDCHGTTDHATAHTPISDTCASCHGGNLVTVHADRGCSVCHNTTYQSIIDAGKTTPVSACTICHVSVDHTAAHDHAKIDSTTCQQCHNSNVVTEHANRNLDCAACHSSTNSNVINAINTGMTGTDVFCYSCHGTTDHAAAHDHAKIDSTTCQQCHNSNVVTEHANRNLDCAACHSSTNSNVINAINTGMTGTDVFCYSCHGTIDHTTAHDYKVVIPYADCESCHATNVVTEHANYNKTCSDCHNATYQSVMSKSFVYCADCHASQSLEYFGNHVAQHDKTFIPAGACLSYATDIVTEHEIHQKGTYCIKCHTSTNSTVISVINSGMAGNSVWCGNCHANMCLPNQSPVANAGPDQTVQAGQSVSFSGEGSYDPEGGTISYAWDFGDSGTSNLQNPSHIYANAGTYTVLLTVTDNKVATGTDTAIVTVTAPLPTNLALNKSTSASGSESGYGPSNAVDGNMTTRWWKKSTSEQWIRVDLGSSMSISKVILKWYSYYAKDYYIETSTDGSNWSNVKSVSGSDGGTDQNTFSSKTARYVRVRCKAAYNYNGYSLYEFEVYK